MRHARWAVLAITLCATTARADDPSGPVASGDHRPPPREPVRPVRPPAPVVDHTAAEVEGQPPPGAESGRTDPIDTGDSGFRIAARGALFIPKIALELALGPVRGGVWAYDRYQLADVYYRTFFSADRTVSLVPTAWYAPGLGGVVGAQFTDRDVFGEAETLGFSATTGGSYRQSHALWLRSGHRFGRLVLGLDGNFERHPDDPFYGIGNGDVASQPSTPIDPRVDPTAVETHNRYQEARVAALADLRVAGPLHVIGHGALSMIQISRGDSGPAIDEVYSPVGLVGFANGPQTAYGELELRWDTRRAASVWEPIALDTTGSLASVFVGRVDRIDHGPDFWHYGAELQHYVRLGSGPRVLALRVRGEGVSGAREQVPFVELPALGGDTFLRGYDYLRFRDRVAAVGTAEYEWDLSQNFDAYVFGDAGRVYSALSDVTLDHLRVGYGVGLAIHDNRGGFLVEGSVASSVDGGIFFNASFNPVLDARPRWR